MFGAPCLHRTNVHYITGRQVYSAVFTARCTIVQSAVLRSHVVRHLSVCPFVTLEDYDHIGSKSWKLIARRIRLTHSLVVAQRPSTYSQGNMEKVWED